MTLFPSDFHFSKKKLAAPTAAECTELFVQFRLEFTNDTACRREFHRILDIMGLMQCKRCGTRFDPLTWGAVSIRCSTCKARNWPVAQTFFHNMREPTAWLAALWFALRGIVLRAGQISRLTSVAPSSARYIRQKITLVADRILAPDARRMPTAAFHRVFTRRSRETPKREHPICEQEGILDILKQYREGRLFELRKRIEQARTSLDSVEWRDPRVSGDGATNSEDLVDGIDADMLVDSLEVYRVSTLFSQAHHCEELTGSVTQPMLSIDGLPAGPGDSLSLAVEERVRSALSSEPRNVDQLALLARLPLSDVLVALTMLELRQAVKQTSGGRYYVDEIESDSCAVYELSKEERHAVDSVTRFIEHNFQGSSRKHADSFITAAAIRFKSVGWTMDSLLGACFEYGVIFYRHLIERVTGDTVNVAAFAELVAIEAVS